MSLFSGNTEINEKQRAPLKREAPVPFQRPSKIKKNQDLIEDRHLEFVENTGFAGGPNRRSGYKLALWSFYASCVDALVAISLTLIFVAFASYFSKKFFSYNVFPKDYASLLPLLAQISVGIYWIYSIVVRVFIGCTLGENSCDLRLGQPSQRIQANYALKVALRSSLNLFSGIVVLPLLSLLFKTDIAGKISGLKLISLK